MARNVDEVRWDRLAEAVGCYQRATESVADLQADDRFRAGRLSALSDVRAVMNHLAAEEGRHS